MHAQQLRSAVLPITAGLLCVAAGGPGGALAPAAAPAVTADQPAAKSGGRIDPKAKEALDRLAVAAKAMNNVTVTVKSITTVSIEGEEHKQEQTATVDVSRPNRLAIRPGADDQMSYVVVSNGSTLTQFMGGMFNMYSSKAAPADLAGLLKEAAWGRELDGDVLMFSPQMLVPALLDDETFKTALLSANKVVYVGREDLGGKPADHLKFTLTRADADIWVSAGDAPRIVKLVPDMTRMFDEMGGVPEEMRDRMPKMAHEFVDWKTPETLADSAFEFKPPAEAKKVDSLMDAMREQMQAGAGGQDEEQADLLGKPAPALELELLEGGKLDLASHRGKNVVMLDFWATWCPPCVRGLPIVSKVAAEFKDKGVVFYAVNEQEQPEVIKKFLKQKELAITVALDKKGDAGNEYGVTGIPQTVLIGKDGSVQAVHVGFSEGMDNELREQLQALVDGKTLAEPKPADAEADAQESMTAEEVWSVGGPWVGAGADPATGDTWAVRNNGRLVRFDRAGKELASVKIGGVEFGSQIRVADIAGDATPEVIVFQRWGAGGVRAIDAAGKTLWQYDGGQGVDDVWLADLDGKDGDGKAETIIGYNGNTGLHCVNGDGKARWTNTSIGNVWYVSANTSGDAREVVTTSAEGAIHVFSGDKGKRVENFAAGGYAGFIRVLPATEAGQEPIIVTELNNGASLAGTSRSGKKLWKQRLDGHITAGAPAPGRPWLAIAMQDGDVRVVDATSGAPLATVDGGQGASVSWIATGEGKAPLLVVASQSGLRALRLEAKASQNPEAAAPAPAQPPSKP